MTDKRWDGATNIDLTIRRKWNGVAYEDLTIAKKWDGATWVDIPIGGGGGFSVTSNRALTRRDIVVFQPPTAPNARVVETLQDVTVSVVGGAGTIVYSWARLSGDSGISATVPDGATTRFSGLVTKNSTKNAAWRCTVTRGADTGYVDVGVTLSYEVD